MSDAKRGPRRLRVVETAHSEVDVSAAEAALVDLRRATSLFGVAIDREARLGDVFSGSDFVWFVDLDNGDDTWGLPLSPLGMHAQTRSDGS